MKYAIVKIEMSNIIAWTVATREDLEKNNTELEIVSWHSTKQEANKNCPRYIIDKNA
jgi:hypothetical protein